RANQTHWGTASDGQSWGGDANSSSVFSISGNAGLVSNSSSTSYSAVLGSSVSDAEVYVTGSISSFASSNFGDVLRWSDGNNWYKAYIDGTNLYIQKKVSGTATVLASVAFSATAGTAYTIHFRVVGSTLTANVWASSGSEPSGWMVTTSDSSLSSGYCGMRVLTQSGTLTMTSFQADVPGGSSTATPTATATATPTPTATATATLTATATPTATSTPTAGTMLGQDTFQRANQTHWGTASDGQSWGGDANSSSVFSISGNAGLVSNSSSTSYSAVLGSSVSDAEVYVTGSISSFASSNFGDVLRWSDGNNWYKAYIDGTNLYIQKKVSGTATVLASVAFSATAGTAYTIHFRVVGSTLTANVWASSGSEPSGWMVTTSDSSLSSGYCGMRVLTQSGTLTMTSFQADVPGGSSTATPTATATATPTPTATATATLTATATPTATSTPTAGTMLGQDTFQRANQTHWGTASDGQSWGGDANSSSVFSISSNAGLVSNTSGTSYSAVLGATATNAEVYVTGSISSFASSNFGDVLRWSDGNNWYKAYIDGTNLYIQKKVSGTATVLASVAFSATAGTAYTIHFRVVGSTLTANVWASSGSEPSGWMVTTSDSSLSSGYCGMRVLTQSGTLTITSFQAKTV